MALEEYEILGILGSSIDSPIYKVRNKVTSEIFIWHAVDYTDYNDAEKQMLIKKLNERKSMIHPHLLKFYNYIECENINIIYVSTEYCERGTLKDIIDKCVKDQKGLREEFIGRIIYQIAFTFKTSKNTIYDLHAENIYLDENYNVKLLNFNFERYVAKDQMKMYQIAQLIYKLCTFRVDEISSKSIILNNNYSSELQTLITNLLDNNNQVAKSVDTLLCHPMILLKSSHWHKDECFYLWDRPDLPKSTKNHDESHTFHEKVQKLRKWEESIKIREGKINEKEHYLNVREKKIAMMERTIKEKLMQAEIYLKRCRQDKSTSSGSSKTSLSKHQKPSYENLDTSCSADCGDSVIVPTSGKLNVDKIIKPTPFIRTLSEKRVRFKGHSPLKEFNFNKKSPKSTVFKDSSSKFAQLEYISEQSSEKSNSADEKMSVKKAKKIFQKQKHENVDENKTMEGYKGLEMERGIRPISWTKETKKQAFELLRAMNSAININTDSSDIKHTYL